MEIMTIKFYMVCKLALKFYLEYKSFNHRVSTNLKIFTYYYFMENFIDSSSSISPIVAILWCLYPIGILVLFELILGGGIDDDNDDQDGGMLIPAYAASKN